MELDDLQQIASAIAHEVRNPIAAIRALASTGDSLYDGLGDDERREFFRLIDDEAERLSQVAEEVSTALKLETGSLAYDLRDASIGDLVREAAEHTPHGEHPLTIEVQGELRARIDRTRLGEVVTQLVDNAVRFSPADAPILVRAARSNGHALIEVSDAGPGIPPERRQEIFGRFSHVRPPGYEEVPGPGLGLFICRAHVGAHGGLIEVFEAPSSSGGGTMLRVEIPMER